MGVNSLPKTVTRQCCGCDMNPGLSVPESSTLTTGLPRHPFVKNTTVTIISNNESYVGFLFDVTVT